MDDSDVAVWLEATCHGTCPWQPPTQTYLSEGEVWTVSTLTSKKNATCHLTRIDSLFVGSLLDACWGHATRHSERLLQQNKNEKHLQRIQ